MKRKQKRTSVRGGAQSKQLFIDHFAGSVLHTVFDDEQWFPPGAWLEGSDLMPPWLQRLLAFYIISRSLGGIAVFMLMVYILAGKM